MGVYFIEWTTDQVLHHRQHADMFGGGSVRLLMQMSALEEFICRLGGV